MHQTILKALSRTRMIKRSSTISRNSRFGFEYLFLCAYDKTSMTVIFEFR